ncbi:hypothetical protein CMUS01_15842 [Colletotrichum musicola]|uniref:Uncharacterized protein n=2 Tax=Colletotrichum orchidearum species complex TaxID=2707337 RepID=A0A8H6MKP5_9PEZI|nr:hypothetical protein CMUS01_15842 [Colletotrichum musicola]KAF6804448.1 hypothetical protein CSOJ01_10175 [Colletotrichum sojae]
MRVRVRVCARAARGVPGDRQPETIQNPV